MRKNVTRSGGQRCEKSRCRHENCPRGVHGSDDAGEGGEEDDDGGGPPSKLESGVGVSSPVTGGRVTCERVPVHAPRRHLGPALLERGEAAEALVEDALVEALGACPLGAHHVLVRRVERRRRRRPARPVPVVQPQGQCCYTDRAGHSE